MSVTQANVDECVAALIASFPIEDIWLLEPARAKECHLDKPVNLIAIVIEGSEPHVISDRYRGIDAEASRLESDRCFCLSALRHYANSPAFIGKDGSLRRNEYL